MKATTWIIIAAALAILAVVFGIMSASSANKAKALEEKNAQLTAEYNTAAETISEIQSSLDALDRDLLGQISPTSEVPGTTPEDRRARLISNIANMRSQIEADKARIAELERQVASSGGQLRNLQSLITQLRNSVADKETILDELQSRLNIANETIETERRNSSQEIQNRERTIAERQAALEEQNVAANSMCYVAASRAQLIEKGVIDRRGGILGIGRVSTVSSDYDTAIFTPFNLIETQTISFPATRKGYAILSDQSADSYTVAKVGENYVLTITNPQQFRRHKYVIIEIL